MPTEFMQHVYDRIVEVGEAVGLAHAGYHALNSLRLEKAYGTGVTISPTKTHHWRRGSVL